MRLWMSVLWGDFESVSVDSSHYFNLMLPKEKLRIYFQRSKHLDINRKTEGAIGPHYFYKDIIDGIIQKQEKRKPVVLIIPNTGN